MDESVRYGLEVIGERVPGRDGQPGRRDPARYSPLRDRITIIQKEEQYWRTWIAIADYGSPGVAGGAMRDMKRHYGEEHWVNGLSFTTHRYAIKDEKTGEPLRDDTDRLVKRCKLLVRYDPEKIDPVKKREWERDIIMSRGRDAAKKLGIDVENLSPGIDMSNPNGDGE